MMRCKHMEMCCGKLSATTLPAQSSIDILGREAPLHFKNANFHVLVPNHRNYTTVKSSVPVHKRTRTKPE